jgi:4-hydroxybenzoate polyprenyl transferase
MLDKIFPIKIQNFLNLIRFYNPIGFTLLMWPCWFALTLVPINQSNLFFWYLLFFIGAFLMRSAGCIINDLVDIKIDRKIQRTINRPLTSKKISVMEALIFLIILLSLSFIILIQFNFKTILTGIISLPLIILYPYMKRVTYFTQLFLGIVFSWGVLLVCIEFTEFFTLDFILLYIGCIFWTLAYDTIYAYQDKNDDESNNIKSTAVFFGNKGKLFVKFFYLIFFLIIGFISWKNNENLYSLSVIIMFIFGMNFLLNKWEPTLKKSSNFYFKFNNIIGLCCFLFLLII